jgi:soluble lytic murein transglycosylase-like protein
VAVAAIESQGDSTAYCRKTTASGLMQLIFSTARQLCRARGIHFPITDKAMRAFLFHPGMSISLGTDHLRNSAIAFHGDVKKMLTGYECGDAIVLARIKNHKGVDNISYVRKVWPVYCYFLEHYKAPIPTALKQSLVSE